MGLAALVWVGLVAVAADPDPVQEAKTYFSAGQQAYQAGFYVDAARAFERAYELVPNPAITFSIAQTYRRQFYIDRAENNLRQSLRAYRKYLQEVARGGRREDAIEHIAALEQQRIALGLPPDGGGAPTEVKAAPTQIMVASETEGALATLDGGNPRPVPLVTEVEVGPHEVRVEAPGHFPETVSAVAVEGRLVVTQVDLRPKPAEIAVRAPSGATVQVDGRLAGEAPLGAPLQVAAGRHWVTATRNGAASFSREVEVGRGERIDLDADMESTLQRKTSYYFLGGGALLLTSTGVMVVIALLSEGQARLILRERDTNMRNLTEDELARYVRARDRRNDLLTVSTASLVGGLVVGGIGAALYFLDEPESPVRPGGLSPILGPDEVGVSWGTTF